MWPEGSFRPSEGLTLADSSGNDGATLRETRQARLRGGLFRGPHRSLGLYAFASESWRPDALPSHACLVKEVQPAVTETLEQLEAYYRPENYEKALYRQVS